MKHVAVPQPGAKAGRHGGQDRLRPCHAALAGYTPCTCSGSMNAASVKRPSPRHPIGFVDDAPFSTGHPNDEAGRENAVASPPLSGALAMAASNPRAFKRTRRRVPTGYLPAFPIAPPPCQTGPPLPVGLVWL